MMQNMIMNMQQNNQGQNQPMMNMLQPNNQPQELKMNKDHGSTEQDGNKPTPTDVNENWIAFELKPKTINYKERAQLWIDVVFMNLCYKLASNKN